MSISINQLGTTADRHTVSRLTYNMLIDIQYVDQHTHYVCRSRYCMSINIQYVDRYTCIDVCRSTYMVCTSIDILYVIEILYVDRQLFPTVNNPPVLTPLPRTSLRLIEFESDSDSQATVTRSDQNCSWCKYHELVASTSLTTSLCHVSQKY